MLPPDAAEMTYSVANDTIAFLKKPFACFHRCVF